MEELRPEHPELAEAERMIFADAGGEVIVISSSDEVQGGEDGGEVGGDDEEIDVGEWRSVFARGPRRRHWPGPGLRHTAPDKEGLARPPLRPKVV